MDSNSAQGLLLPRRRQRRAGPTVCYTWSAGVLGLLRREGGAGSVPALLPPPPPAGVPLRPTSPRRWLAAAPPWPLPPAGCAAGVAVSAVPPGLA